MARYTAYVTIIMVVDINSFKGIVSKLLLKVSVYFYKQCVLSSGTVSHQTAAVVSHQRWVDT